jgi:hypothetical protein
VLRRVVCLLATGLLLGGALARATDERREPAFYATPKVVSGEHVIDVLRGDSLKRIVTAAEPGDVIQLGAGTYAAPGGLSLTRSGRADAWIVLRGSGKTRPAIDLAGGELHIGASFVLLENLEIVNGTGNNIHVVPPNGRTPISNIVLRGLKSAEMGRGTGAALKIAGLWNSGHGAPTELVYVEDCDLSGSRDNAIVDAVGVRRSVVRRCWIHEPVRISQKSPGIFFKGGSSEILIERNLVSGIRGNAAVMVGGDTGAKWFDARNAAPKLEGADQLIRNNLVADFDDAAFEVRGVRGARIVANTVVTSASSFAIFRLTWGGSGSGSRIGNSDIEIADNLVIATRGPKFALNDGNEDATVRFGPQLWAGRFARGGGGGIPPFPQEQDTTVDARELENVVANPRDDGLHGLADALARFRVVAGSPAIGAGAPIDAAPRDIVDLERSTHKPSLGAFESAPKH